MRASSGDPMWAILLLYVKINEPSKQEKKETTFFIFYFFTIIIHFNNIFIDRILSFPQDSMPNLTVLWWDRIPGSPELNTEERRPADGVDKHNDHRHPHCL